MTSTRPSSKRQRNAAYADLDELNDVLGDSASSFERPLKKRPRINLRTSRRSTRNRHEDDSEDDRQDQFYTRRSTRRSSGNPRIQLRGLRREVPMPDEDSVVEAESSADEMSMLVSDVGPQRKRRGGARSNRPSYVSRDGTIFDKAPKNTRQSGRVTRHQGAMIEVGEDQIQRSDSEPRAPAAPKVVSVKEAFKVLPRTDPFRTLHVQQCDTCNQGSNSGPLIYCQGCSFAYHKGCLGNRSSREHLVTKIGPSDFVLQCRRCIRFVQKKEATAPDQSKCHDCKAQGPSCKAFRARKTSAQEQKDREINGGEDPIYPVPTSYINNPSNVLFRCVSCYRGFHYEHLPPRSDSMELDSENAAATRFAEYAQDWKCKDCVDAPAKVRGLVAWKPVDEDNYDPTKTVDEINEDDKIYLVRWEGLSYFRAMWMPGAWVWGVTGTSMRKAFTKREDAVMPKTRTEDAIPEEYLRADIVLDVKYTSIVDIAGEEIDKARIKEVKKALIKFKGLGYEDAVWETPPLPEDEDRWVDFVTAYNDWVAGKYVHIPKNIPLKARLEKARGMDFEAKLEKKKQPDNLVGGELMKYQLEGLNWLYYKWYTQKNAILADEMGLGKTIQIIGFLATLVSDWNCFPFLVVVPNATCANWRREIKQWAPALRVVAYFGSQAARDMAYRYELFPRQSKDPRCHIVVTSYEAAADPANKRFFKSVSWQALIVDEGQRLKSDKTILYNALMDLNIPFRILLTGTPLQNNQRELFNLLQFLEDGYDAASMEVEYQDLDNEKVARLHDLIRPFFLRRTKVQVLTFLPPMAQIILPVSMSFVQKKLYRSILAKTPDLLRALFKEKRDLKNSERGSLNNILMQLRKCLCHPFVYSKSIEERNVSHSASHRNLVEASGKLQLLEVLLPKLQERGHRVLIFSQFLDMLTMVEDFLDGLGMQYGRLDGSMSSLQKQKRIDKFNAPDSELFAFLLSTRAGGVGINLATADTVIILDPDFNPHQDIQALSRAHRIGQKKKVLCFQLVTKASAEEKIVQIGRTKIALDHILIESMDAEDASEKDLQSILAYGAAELFSDEGDKDIKYDSAEVDKLLDRSQIEDTKAGEDKSAESQFSFARIWANDDLEDTLQPVEAEDQAPDPGLWDKILKEREKVAAAEAAAAREAFGRGRRAKQVNIVVDYGSKRDARDGSADVDADLPGIATVKKAKDDDENDTDFQADSDAESKDDEPDEDADGVDAKEIEGLVKKPSKPGECSLVVKLKISHKDILQKLAESTKPVKEPSRKAVAKAAQPAKKTGPAKREMVEDSKAAKQLSKFFKVSKGPTFAEKIRSWSDSSKPDSKQTSVGAEKQTSSKAPSTSLFADASSSAPTFRRVAIPTSLTRSSYGLPTPPPAPDQNTQHFFSPDDMVSCPACHQTHLQGNCALKKAGVEYCNLCGTAHFGYSRICPHINSETQVRAMLDALKQSPEAGHLVREARKYLTGVKGTLVQKKKVEEEKRRRQREEGGFRPVLNTGVAARWGAVRTEGQVVQPVGGQTQTQTQTQTETGSGAGVYSCPQPQQGGENQ
ncbi:hypothetical protein K461DRAFT_228333 [Myriangium duriaei CBS 260.36]|uniref:Uncharacterized protein n=1 Tax=Myriangium duriaei CBS 260.36 TaxID=1168546 RepID=A0A9P4MER0_9PEZI|nr:hypothetical protein K461DRAFT_228333 [Myriangium duriaei CBS 260.36]